MNQDTTFAADVANNLADVLAADLTHAIICVAAIEDDISDLYDRSFRDEQPIDYEDLDYLEEQLLHAENDAKYFIDTFARMA